MPATFWDLSCINLFSSEAAKPEWTMTSKVLKFLRTEERSLPFSGYNFVMRMSQSFGKHLFHMSHKEHDMHILAHTTYKIYKIYKLQKRPHFSKPARRSRRSRRSCSLSVRVNPGPKCHRIESSWRAAMTSPRRRWCSSWRAWLGTNLPWTFLDGNFVKWVKNESNSW